MVVFIQRQSFTTKVYQNIQFDHVNGFCRKEGRKNENMDDNTAHEWRTVPVQLCHKAG